MHYDMIIIGTGAGGGTLAHQLAPTGKRILILERGEFLPREKENWDAVEVYQKSRYYTDAEKWVNKEDKEFAPSTCYWVGGNTKVYGSALLRLRERDFDEVQHKDGISPAWPLKHADFAPYYDQAEVLFDVHGERSGDPTEPTTHEYPYPAVSHEPAMQQISNNIQQAGYYPFHLPVGLKINEVDKTLSQCIRCDTCDGFPCLVDGKADSEVNCINGVRSLENVTLLTGAFVKQLLTDASGRTLTAVRTEVNGEEQLFSADIVVVACGAINSAALLLRSANDAHPNGLANRSDQVGRNFMKHLSSAIVALSAQPNPAVHQKTIGLNDFYWGEPDFPYPMGMVQNTGNVKGGMMPAESPPLLAPYVKITPETVLDVFAAHSTGWWLQTEDLPEANNRVRVVNGQIHLDYTPNNIEARDRLIHRWTSVLKATDRHTKHVVPFSLYPRNIMPLAAVAHQCGTCRFGPDAETAVLDLNCRAHEVDNLYVVDGSFFPSNSGVNPTLTIIANAIRVAEHLKQRLGVSQEKELVQA